MKYSGDVPEPRGMKGGEIFCSFCRKPSSEVAQIVSDPTGKVFICNECIKLCHQVVMEAAKPTK